MAKTAAIVILELSEEELAMAATVASAGNQSIQQYLRNGIVTDYACLVEADSWEPDPEVFVNSPGTGLVS